MSERTDDSAVAGPAGPDLGAPSTGGGTPGGPAAAAGERADVVRREAAFFDAKSRRYASLRRWISRAIGAFNRSDEVHALYDPAGKRVLDYGCGEGRFSFELLDRGAAHVTGIDISEARIEAAKERARERGVQERVAFSTADAHATGLTAGSFDLVIGSDILHHLDLEAALLELKRLLAPGGTAVFVEPLAHHPLLRVGRWLTPGARTSDEHPLTVDDWRLCDRIFPRFRHTERELVTIPLMPLNLVLPQPAQRRLAAVAGRVDDRLLRRFAGLRRYARRTILLLGA